MNDTPQDDQQPQATDDAALEQDTAKAMQQQAMRRESFEVNGVEVIGQEEERDEDDNVVQPAGVAIVFRQTAHIPGVLPSPDGSGNLVMATTSINLTEYVARPMKPALMIEVGKYLQEEAERVLATMKYPDGDPAEKARQSGLIVAGAGAEEKTARALDTDRLASAAKN